jgi:hypothetical protein
LPIGREQQFKRILSKKGWQFNGHSRLSFWGVWAQRDTCWRGNSYLLSSREGIAILQGIDSSLKLLPSPSLSLQRSQELKNLYFSDNFHSIEISK